MSTRLKSIRIAILLVLLAFALFVPGVRAQGSGSLAQANVPFAFQYGSHVFASGKYVIGMTSDNVMSVRGGSHAALGLVRWNEDRQPPSRGKLVFHRYGDTYVLTEVWSAHHSAHIECAKPKVERRPELAQIEGLPSTVEIALLETSR